MKYCVALLLVVVDLVVNALALLAGKECEHEWVEIGLFIGTHPEGWVCFPGLAVYKCAKCGELVIDTRGGMKE